MLPFSLVAFFAADATEAAATCVADFGLSVGVADVPVLLENFFCWCG
jgi:hypothetical protein